MKKYNVDAAQLFPASEMSGGTDVYLWHEVDAHIANTVATYTLERAQLQHRIAELEQALRHISAHCREIQGGAPPHVWIPAAVRKLGL